MLINCPECGKPVSDTVKTCPHCGFQFKKCDECGSIVALEAQTCSNCGFAFTPQTEEKKPEAPKVEEKKPEPKKKEKKKTDPKKESERLFKQEEKKARKVAAFIEKVNYGFKWAARGIYLIAVILIAIAVIKLIDFASYKKKSAEEVLKLLANAKKINESIHALLLSGIIVVIVGVFVETFKTFLYSYLVQSKIRQEGFDYKTFYENYPVDEDGVVLPPMFLMSESLFDHTDIQLTEVIRYKDYLPSIAFKLIRNVIGIFLIVVAVTLIYPVLTENVDSLMALVVLGEEKTFKPIFGAKLIWGVGVIAVKIIVLDFILDRDMEEAHSWLKKIHKPVAPISEAVETEENE